MSDNNLPTICGLFCGTCPIYDCCVNTRHLGHCGRCSECLCEKYTQLKAPTIPDRQAEAINKERKRELFARAKKHTR